MLPKPCLFKQFTIFISHSLPLLNTQNKQEEEKKINKKTKKPRSIPLQEISSLIFSVTDSRKGATQEKEVKQWDLEH